MAYMDLVEFLEQGKLDAIIGEPREVFCKECPHDCEDCHMFPQLSHIADQIIDEAQALIETLAHEWVKAQES